MSCGESSVLPGMPSSSYGGGARMSSGGNGYCMIELGSQFDASVPCRSSFARILE
ncbi:MAG: hypothetical protein WDN24_14605 [Sphingomonas sp.]